MFRALFRIFDYSGRSSRWEYWSFAIGLLILFVPVGAGVLTFRDGHDGQLPQLTDDQGGVLALAYIGLVGLPLLALKVRRYHDFGWSGWAVLWVLVPVINIFMEFMLLFRGPIAPAVDTRADYDQRPITIYNSPGTMSAGPGQSQGGHVDQIARLADLHAQGALSAKEFAAAKAKVLRS